MSDAFVVVAVDSEGTFGEYHVPMPDGSAPGLVAALVVLLDAATAPVYPQVLQTTVQYDDPAAVIGDVDATGLVSDALKLTFETAVGDYVLYVPGVLDAGYLAPDGDGVRYLDETWAPGQDLIAWLLAQALSDAGEPLVSLLDARLSVRATGRQKVLAAGRLAETRGMAAQWSARHGAGVRDGS